MAKVIVFSKFFPKIPQTLVENVAILGNGPSLKTSLENNTQFFKNTALLCVNMFSKSAYYQKFKPKNYILLDGAFADTTHLVAKEAILHLVKDTTWELNLFVPYSFRKSSYFQKDIPQNTFIKIHYFNYTIVAGFDWLIFWLFKHNVGMPQCQNVLVAATFMAINQGFKNIYLFGADHSWHEMIKLDENNRLFMEDNHFYGSKKSDLQQSAVSFLSRQFLSLHKAFYGYEVLAKYANYRKANIWNASLKSYIDVFEKIKI